MDFRCETNAGTKLICPMEMELEINFHLKLTDETDLQSNDPSPLSTANSKIVQ